MTDKSIPATFLPQIREKYNHLRSAYESRILSLSERVNNVCEELLHDDIIVELKKDPIGVSFLPAHIKEIFERFLHSERERYVTELMEMNAGLKYDHSTMGILVREQKEKIDKLEPEVVQLRRTALAIDPLKEKLFQLQAEFDLLSQKSDADVVNITADRDQWKNNFEVLQDQNNALKIDMEKLKYALSVSQGEADKYRNDSTTLSRTIELNLTEIKASKIAIDERDNKVWELQKLTSSLSEENKTLLAKVLELQHSQQIIKDELSRTQESLDRKGMEESECSRKLVSLMSQVEGILHAEGEDSSAAIAAAHEKLRVLRHRFVVELQKEKRVVVALQTELGDAKRARDDIAQQCHGLTAELGSIRATAQREKDLITSLQEDLNKNKTKLSDRVARLLRAEEKIEELEKNRDREWKLMEQKLRLEFQETLQEEIARSREREQTLRQKYENEISVLNARQLRASISADGNGLSYLGAHVNTSFGGAVPFAPGPINQSYVNEFLPTNQNHVRLNSVARSSENTQVNGAVSDLAGATALENLRLSEQSLQRQVTQLQGRLAEAAQHIDTLRGMVVALQQFKKLHLSEMQTSVVESHDSHSRVSATDISSVESLSKTRTTKSHRYDKHYQSRGSQNITAAGIRKQADPDENGDAENGISDDDRAHYDLPPATNVSRQQTLTAVNTQAPISISGPVGVGHRRKSFEAYVTDNPVISSASFVEEELQIANNRNRELEIEIAALRESLTETKERALQDQQRDSVALENMRKKFGLLMSRYEAAIAATSVPALPSISSGEPGNLGNQSNLAATGAINSGSLSARSESGISVISSSSSSSAAPIGVQPEAGENEPSESAMSVLQSKLQMLQLLEANLQQRLDDANKTNESMAKERDKRIKAEERIRQLELTLWNVNNSYRQQVFNLRQGLQDIRGAVVSSVAAFSPDKIVWINQFKQLHSEWLAKWTESLDKAIKSDRLNLTAAFSAEKQALQAAFESRTASMQIECESRLNDMRNRVIREASNAQLGKDYSTGGVYIEATDSRSQGGFESEAKLSSMKSMNSSGAFAFESVLRGCLEALSEQQLITAETLDQIINLAREHVEPSFAASSVAKALVFNGLDTLLTTLHDAEMKAIIGSPIGEEDMARGGASKILALEAELIAIRQVHSEEQLQWTSERQKLLNKLNQPNSSSLRSSKGFSGVEVPPLLSSAISDTSSIFSTTSTAGWADGSEGGLIPIAGEVVSSSQMANPSKQQLKLEKEKRRRIQAELLEQQVHHQEATQTLQRQLLELQQRAEAAELKVVELKMRT